MNAPFFSIVMATYNRADLIPRALESLIGQSESDWELIVVDDGSTDDTQRVIRPVLQQIARYRYIKLAHVGVTEAKNTAIAAAGGRYVTFLDSDDEYKPNHLQSRRKLLAQSPDTDFLHGGVEIIGDAYVTDYRDPSRKIHLDQCAISGTFVVRQEAVRQLKGFMQTDLSKDADFLQRAQQLGLKIVKTDISTYIYHREGGTSITRP